MAVKILYYCAAPGPAPAPEPRQEDTRGPGTPEQAEAHPGRAAAGVGGFPPFSHTALFISHFLG